MGWPVDRHTVHLEAGVPSAAGSSSRSSRACEGLSRGQVASIVVAVTGVVAATVYVAHRAYDNALKECQITEESNCKSAAVDRTVIPMIFGMGGLACSYFLAPLAYAAGSYVLEKSFCCIRETVGALASADWSFKRDSVTEGAYVL